MKEDMQQQSKKDNNKTESTDKSQETKKQNETQDNEPQYHEKKCFRCGKRKILNGVCQNCGERYGKI